MIALTIALLVSISLNLFFWWIVREQKDALRFKNSMIDAYKDCVDTQNDLNNSLKACYDNHNKLFELHGQLSENTESRIEIAEFCMNMKEARQ